LLPEPGRRDNRPTSGLTPAVCSEALVEFIASLPACAFTDREIESSADGEATTLSLADVLQYFPVALLLGVE
jgi:hypothetical protein